MVWRRLITQFSRQQSELGQFGNLFSRNHLSGNRLLSGQQRFNSRSVGDSAHRVRVAEAAHVRELHHRNDPETMIRLFESEPSLHSNRSALSEYVKALVEVDRLDESELLKTLQEGISNSAREEEGKGGLLAFKNVGKSTKHGVLGTANAPIHMVASEGGHFKDQLWRTFHSIALGFLLISAVGALVEDRGISKGLGLYKEVQVVESNTKFNDVKGVDEARAELEEIVHYL